MKILKWLDENLEKSVLFLFLVGMVLIMGIQIVARYLFNNSLVWSEEITRFLFIWSTFLSIGYCLKQKISLKIDTLVAIFPKKAQIYMHIIANLLMLAFFAYMIPYAYEFAYSSVVNHQTSAACGVPMYLIQGSILIGFILAAIRCIQEIYTNIRTLAKKGEQ